MRRIPQIRKAVVIAAAILVLVPLVAVAGHFGNRPEGSFGHGFLMGRMVERLELAEGQRDEIHGILEASREQIAPLMIERSRLERELAEAIHAEVFDEAAVRELAGKLGEAGAELAVQRGRSVQQVMAVLTPEQRAEARQLREERGDFGGRRHGPHGRGRGGRPAPSE